MYFRAKTRSRTPVTLRSECGATSGAVIGTEYMYVINAQPRTEKGLPKSHAWHRQKVECENGLDQCILYSLIALRQLAAREQNDVEIKSG